MWNLLVRLLDIEELREADPGSVVLRWQPPWANWVLLLTALLAVLFVVLTYERERLRPRLRLVLTGLRVFLVALMVAWLCRPVLVWERTREEPSVTALLIDTSASMGLRDLYADPREAAAARFAAERHRRAAPAEAPQAASPGSGEPSADRAAPSPPEAAAPPEGAARALPDTAASPPDEPPSPHTAGAAPGQQHQLLSRFELLGGALDPAKGPGGPLNQCLATNQLAVYGFGGELLPVGVAASGEQLGTVLGELWSRPPEQPTTDPAGAIEKVLNDSRYGRLAAVVVASDGRATSPSDYRRLIDLAKRRRVPVVPLLIGSTAPTVDLAVGPLRAEETVFVKDIVAIRGTLRAEMPEARAVQLDLYEQRREQPLASQTVSVGGADRRAEFEFRIRPFRTGRHTYRVVARVQPDEIDRENNSSGLEIRAIEDKVRVLYVEAYPRYEYRYLKNTLLREPTIVSSVLLLSADEGFAQEGNSPVTAFPQSEEELFAYDVVIFGDVDPGPSGAGGRVGWLTDRQAELLVNFVGRRGGGFILIAGQRWAPQAFRGTSLEKLLPVVIDPQQQGLSGGGLQGEGSTISEGYHLELTPEGRDSPVFRFEAEPEENLKTIAGLPALYWYAATLGPKPAAEVLARHPLERTGRGAMPLVATSRYGAGRVYFHGTDDTWRWRRGGGEAFYDAYWLQAIRYCTENRLLAQTRAARLFADRKEHDYGEAVKLTMQLTGADLAETLPEEIAARYRSVDRKYAGEFTLSRVGPKARIFEGRFTPPAAGSYVVSAEVDHPAGRRSEPRVGVRVRATSLELVHRQADHEALRQLAEQTGGRALYLDELDRLAPMLPDRRVSIPDDVAEPLWDTRLVLGLMVLILVTEWSLRKWFGLI